MRSDDDSPNVSCHLFHPNGTQRLYPINIQLINLEIAHSKYAYNLTQRSLVHSARALMSTRAFFNFLPPGTGTWSKDKNEKRCKNKNYYTNVRKKTITGK